MGISIDHDEIEHAIRQLASERGLTVTDAIGMAVRRELARSAGKPTLQEKIRRIQDRVAARGVTFVDADEIIGYDENGLPT